MPLSALGFIRFDVEDFLTPESDEALVRMIASMHRAGLPGSYGLVGKKVLALKERGRLDALELLRSERAIGFHSWSHSEHPTLAEELCQLPYEDGVRRFIDRERPGVEAVTRLVKPPRYFTQPGGNWVPEALEALPALGMNVFFTDSFNSYIEDLTAPYWLGEVLHLSFPVVNPRPFGLGLPGNLNKAVKLVEEWQERTGDAFMVMLHPTELVSREFWDAANFSRGRVPERLKPAPLRTRDEQEQALKAFDDYCQAMSRLAIEWCDAETLASRIAPREPIRVNIAELARAVRQQGLGPMELTTGTLSAAEALYALARGLVTGRDAMDVGYIGAPEHWQEAVSPIVTTSQDRARTFAFGVVKAVDATGRLPSEPTAGLTLEAGVSALIGKPVGRLRFLDYIKPQKRLHWDWPIFPDPFRPVRLWQDARRLGWTMKRAQFRDELRNNGKEA
nr:hypothetical protein [Sulfobacillus harzensis]